MIPVPLTVRMGIILAGVLVWHLKYWTTGTSLVSELAEFLGLLLYQALADEFETWKYPGGPREGPEKKGHLISGQHNLPTGMELFLYFRNRNS